MAVIHVDKNIQNTIIVTEKKITLRTIQLHYVQHILNIIMKTTENITININYLP